MRPRLIFLDHSHWLPWYVVWGQCHAMQETPMKCQHKNKGWRGSPSGMALTDLYLQCLGAASPQPRSACAVQTPPTCISTAGSERSCSLCRESAKSLDPPRHCVLSHRQQLSGKCMLKSRLHLYEYQPPKLLSPMLPTRALRFAMTAGLSL